MTKPEATNHLMAACIALNKAACATHDGCVPATRKQAISLAADAAAHAYALLTGQDWALRTKVE